MHRTRVVGSVGTEERGCDHARARCVRENVAGKSSVPPVSIFWPRPPGSG